MPWSTCAAFPARGDTPTSIGPPSPHRSRSGGSAIAIAPPSGGCAGPCRGASPSIRDSGTNGSGPTPIICRPPSSRLPSKSSSGWFALNGSRCSARRPCPGAATGPCSRMDSWHGGVVSSTSSTRTVTSGTGSTGRPWSRTGGSHIRATPASSSSIGTQGPPGAQRRRAMTLQSAISPVMDAVDAVPLRTRPTRSAIATETVSRAEKGGASESHRVAHDSEDLRVVDRAMADPIRARAACHDRDVNCRVRG